MTISFGVFLLLLWNISIFLQLSNVLAKLDKKKATLFAVLALIISLMPWVKPPFETPMGSTQAYYKNY